MVCVGVEEKGVEDDGTRVEAMWREGGRDLVVEGWGHSEGEQG